MSFTFCYLAQVQSSHQTQRLFCFDVSCGMVEKKLGMTKLRIAAKQFFLEVLLLPQIQRNMLNIAKESCTCIHYIELIRATSRISDPREYSLGFDFAIVLLSSPLLLLVQ